MLLLAAAAPVLACGANTYSCTDGAQCGDGFCEETGLCSFADDGCESGRRYAEYAGALSGLCVPPTSNGSSGVGTESTATEAMTLTSGDLSSSSSASGSGSDTGVSASAGETARDPEPICGDGSLDEGEACDDGNDIEGDGCSTECIRSGMVLWSHVRSSEASTLEQFSGVAVLGEDPVVAGLGVAGGPTQDILVQRWTPEGESVWDVAHDVDGDADRGAGLVVGADAVTVFGTATVAQSDASTTLERWVGQFSSNEGSLVREATLGEGELFGGVVSDDGVVLVGTDGTGDSSERGWAGNITAELAVASAVVDPGDEASQYNDVAVLPGGETFVAGMRGASTETEADFIVDAVSPMSVSPVQRIAAEFSLTQAQGIAAAARGELFVGGHARQELGGRQLYLERFSLADGVQWSSTESSADSESDEIEAVAVAPNGDVLVTGLYWGGLRRETDVLLRRFDANGELRWAAEIDFAGDRDLGRGIVVSSEGAVYVAGRVTTAAGDVRAYVARVVP
ncbi:MAG: hypothetical protein ACRBN8_31080 [Nannocystales bacterium]